MAQHCPPLGGYLFLLNVGLIFALWMKDARLQKWDWQWLKGLAGLLGERGGLVAGRFNAGQKLYLWLILLIALILGSTGLVVTWAQDSNVRMVAHTIDAIAAFVLIIIVLVQVYLGVLANPGTVRGIFEGQVSLGWASKLHPLWEPKKTEKS